MNSNDWLDIIKNWCYEEESLNNLKLSQQAKLAQRLSFLFYPDPDEPSEDLLKI
jgi:hypothetical protein